MVLLENDAFLSELTKFFQKSKSNGSVSITMKRYDGRTKPKPKDKPVPEPSEYKCLFRAILGSKKISTVVSPRDVNKFQMAYVSLLKGNIDGLKKREKRGEKKSNKGKKAKAI